MVIHGGIFAAIIIVELIVLFNRVDYPYDWFFDLGCFAYFVFIFYLGLWELPSVIVAMV
jgi:hypothetical protein